MKNGLLSTVARLLCLGGMIASGLIASNQAMAADADEVPQFRYDPDWPKQLPNAWTVGVTGAIYITKDDHIWIAHRPNSITAPSENAALEGLGECCTPAPPVIEFDTAGNVIQAWGAIHQIKSATLAPSSPYTPGKDVLVGKQVSGPYPDGVWPMSEHAMFVDYKNNVWLTSQLDPSQVVKFTHDGKLIKLFGEGKEAASSNDTKNFAGPTAVYVDPQTNEAYISDGYRNRRIIVLDADTGAFKRMWGAYGKPPKAEQQKTMAGSQKDDFAVTHCVVAANDGLLYVCDRANSRIQVFKKDGTYVREVFVGADKKSTYGNAWFVAFSADKDQRFLYLADGSNKKIWILRRSDLKVIGSLGHGGRKGGEFMSIHCLAVDSKGNIYTGETLSGNRIQRFLFTGVGPASAN